MSEITNVETAQEENFAELLEQSIKTLNTGDKVTGIVTGDRHRPKSRSIWAPSMPATFLMTNVSTDPSVKPEDILKVGDEIEVFVVRVNDAGRHRACCPRRRLDGLKVWDEIEECRARTRPRVEGTITEENKGGAGRQCQGHPRVHPRFSDRPAPRAATMSELVASSRSAARSPRSTVPAAVWSAPSVPSTAEARKAAAGEDLERDRSGQEVPRHCQVPDFLRRICGHRRCGRHGPRFRAVLEPHQDIPLRL